MNSLAPSRLTRWIIGILVGLFFATPMIATLLFTLSTRDGGLTGCHWAGLLYPKKAALYAPIWTGVANSLALALVTVLIVLFLLAPTMLLVALRFPRLGSARGLRTYRGDLQPRGCLDAEPRRPDRREDLQRRDHPVE